MADTATMSALLASDGVVGSIRETVSQSGVLLWGSNVPGSAADDSHGANPVGFAGIAKTAEGVTPGDPNVKIRLHMRNNPAGGYRLENERFSEPGNDKYVMANDPLRYYYAQFLLTGQLLKAAAAGEKSFKGAFQESSDRLVRSAAIDVNQAAFGNGSGVRATLRNNEAAAQTVIDVDTTIYFRTGEIVDGLTISTGVVIEPARLVTAVDRANRTITVSPALTTGLTATTDGFVRAVQQLDHRRAEQLVEPRDQRPGQDRRQLRHGPRPLADALPDLGRVRSGLGWRDQRRRASPGEGHRRLRDGHQRVGMEFALITTRGVRSNYADTQLPLKRHVNMQTLKGGFDAIMFDDNPIFVDDACQPGYLYGIRTKKFIWATMQDWDWMDRDGAILARVPGRDQYTATLFAYHQFMTTERGAHFKLTGITDTVR